MCCLQTSLIFHNGLAFIPQEVPAFPFKANSKGLLRLSRLPHRLASVKHEFLSGRGITDVKVARIRCFQGSQSGEQELQKNSLEEINDDRGAQEQVLDVKESEDGNKTKELFRAEATARSSECSKNGATLHTDEGRLAQLETLDLTPEESLDAQEIESKWSNRDEPEPVGLPLLNNRLSEEGGAVDGIKGTASDHHSAKKIAEEDLSPEKNNGTTIHLSDQDREQSKMMRPFDLGGIWGPAWEKLKSNPIVHWVEQWDFWQQKRRLEHLQAQADAYPMDASKQSALLAELNKHSPEAVVKRFEQREHATDGQAVVEYLRALIITNAIAEYLPDERAGKSSSLPALLQELKQRATGRRDEPFASPGLTEKHPLHVVMVDAKGSSKSMRFIQELISTFLFMIFFSVLWVMLAAALRKYVSGISGMGTSSGISSGAAYVPKEYNKETLPEKNTKTFKDVKGCEEAKEELEEIVEYLKNPAKFTRLGGKLPKGVLLTGPPGTGKTLLAKAIAGEAGVPFFYRAGSEFEEMFVGVGARRVRALFHAAKKKAPCIIFIDEIDAVGSTRKQWEGHTKKTLHQLLVEMDGFESNEGIIVVAATNLPEALDPALTRPGRFDRHVVVNNPDVRGRQEILELYLQNKPLAEDVDVKSIARGTPGFTGADLANLVNMAALKAAIDGAEKLTNSQLEFAKDKILMGTERKSFVLSEESRKLTAYHESGHAVVAFNTLGAYPIHKATITPRGNSLGMVSQLPDKDETSVSKVQMLARLDIAMGGRVAEELIFGTDQVTSGARSDLQHATALARHMVSECGMSDSIGPIFVGVDDQRPSQDIQRSIDAEVVRLLKEAYERVKILLRKHEADLHALARALLEQETLTAREIKEILSPFQHVTENAEAISISS